MLYLMFIILVLYELSCNGITARVEYRRQLPLRQLMLRAGYNFGSRHKMPVAKQAELLAAVLDQVKKVGQTQRDKDKQLDNAQRRRLLLLLQRNYAAHQRYGSQARVRTGRISNQELIQQFQQRLKEMETPKTLTAEDYSSAEHELPSLKKVLRNLRRGVGDTDLLRNSPAFLHKSLGERRYGNSGKKKKKRQYSDDSKDLKVSSNEVKKAALDDSNWNRKHQQSSYTKKTTKWKIPEIKVFALTTDYRANKMNNDGRKGERFKVISKSESKEATDKVYSKKATDRGYSKEATDKVNSKEANDRAYSKKVTDRGYSKEANDRGYSKKATDRGYSKEANDRVYSKKATDRGYSKEANERGYSKKATDRGYSKEANDRGYSKKATGRGYSKEANDRGYSKKATGRGYSKEANDKEYLKENTDKRYSKERTYKNYSQERERYKKETMKYSPTFSVRSTTRWTPASYKYTERKIDVYRTTPKEQNGFKESSGKKLFGRTPMQFLGKVGIYEEK